MRITDHEQEKRQRRIPLDRATTLRINATGTDLEVCFILQIEQFNFFKIIY